MTKRIYWDFSCEHQKTLKNKKYVPWSMYLPNVVVFHTSLWKYLTVIVIHPRSKVMVPIESPWAVSYLTSFESNIVFEILDIKDIFP